MRVCGVIPFSLVVLLLLMSSAALTLLVIEIRARLRTRQSDHLNWRYGNADYRQEQRSTGLGLLDR